jgi:WD40 repeat protein
MSSRLQSEVTSLCYLPHPEILVTGHHDGTLLVWKKDTHEQEKYFYHSGTISSIQAFESRDGSYQVVSTDHSGTLCLWKQEGEILRFAKKKHLIKDIANMPQAMQKLLYGTPEESDQKAQVHEMLHSLHLSGSNMPRVRTIQAALSATKGHRNSLLGRRLSARLSIPLEDDSGEKRRRSQIEAAKDELYQRGVAITSMALFLPVQEELDDLIIVGCEDGIVRFFLVNDLVLVSMLDTTLGTRPVSSPLMISIYTVFLIGVETDAAKPRTKCSVSNYPSVLLSANNICCNYQQQFVYMGH